MLTCSVPPILGEKWKAHCHNVIFRLAGLQPSAVNAHRRQLTPVQHLLKSWRTDAIAMRTTLPAGEAAKCLPATSTETHPDHPTCANRCYSRTCLLY